MGLDLGLVGELRRGQLGGGFQLRGLLTAAYVTFYGSFISVYDARERDFRQGAQVGLLLKVPFILKITGEPWRP